MSSVNEFLYDLRKRGVSLWAEGENIRYRAEQGTVRDSDIQHIRANKPAILELLRNITTPVAVPDPEPRPLKHVSSPPMTAAQIMMHGVSRTVTDPVAYNVHVTQRLNGPLDTSTLRESLLELETRHEALRTRYVLTPDQPMGQQIIDPPGGLAVKLIDLTSVSHDQLAERVDREIRRIAYQRFDVEKRAPFEVGLIVLSHDEHILVFSGHHIATDEVSSRTIIGDLIRIYEDQSRSRPSSLPPAFLQMSDIAVWENNVLSGERLSQRQRYWATNLSGANLTVPFGGGLRPNATAEGLGEAHMVHVIPASAWQSIRDFSAAQNATPNLVILTAIYTLMFRWSGMTDVTTGWINANRELPHTARMVGCFAQLDLLRVSLPAHSTVLDALNEVTRQYGDMRDNNLPLVHIDEDYFSMVPNIQINFLFPQIDQPPSPTSGILWPAITPIAVSQPREMPPVYDLRFRMTETKDGFQIVCSYKSDLFEAAAIKQILNYIEYAVGTLISTPRARLSDLRSLAF